MNLHRPLQRLTAMFLLLSLFLGFLPTNVLAAKTTEVTESTQAQPTPVSQKDTGELIVPTYPDIADYYEVSNDPFAADRTAMGGLAFANGWLYYVRCNEEGSNSALFRTNPETRKSESVSLSNSARLGTGKELTAAVINGNQYYLFVSTGKTGGDAILMLSVTDDIASIRCGYTLKDGSGNNLCADGLALLSTSGTSATLLIRSGYNFYTATVNTTATADSTLTATFAFGVQQNATLTMAKTLVNSAAARTTALSGMEYSAELDRLYLAVTADCSTGILAYCDITSLIASHTTSASATLHKSIAVGGTGYEFFHVRDMALVQGVLYFNSRMRWLDPEHIKFRGDICHLLDSTSYERNRQLAYRESSTYLVCGTNTLNMVFCNYKDGDTYKVKIKDKSAETLDDDLISFGFESDTQGYWYIRSGIYIPSTAQVADLYLTAEDDGTVSLKPKDPGNPKQLWFTYCTGLKDDGKTKMIAIFSKATGHYLTNGTSGTDLYNLYVNTTNPKTFVLQHIKNTAKLEEYLFDYEFYKLAYPETANMTKAQALNHFNNTGKGAGYLPGPYFDPVYYISHNSDVKKSYGESNYAAAYTHFVKYGYWEGRQGSLYFSASEYISRSKTASAYKLYMPEKEKILYHFVTYGADDAAITEHWTGSNSFSIKEYAEEYNLTASSGNVTYGLQILREYVASLIRLKNCQTLDEFYDLVFDANVYAYMNRTDLTQSKLDNGKISGSTYSEQLRNHWNGHGRGEGRTASFLFVPSYYATRYYELGVTLENAHEHYFNTGREQGLVGSPYISISTDGDIVCDHLFTATARFDSCTAVCELVTFCASCHDVINRVQSPALAHKDTNSDNTCDLCSKAITDTLLAQNAILSMELPGWDNELLSDVSGFKSISTAPYGAYYLVQKGADGIYRVMDPMSQTPDGTLAATRVNEIGGRILGADPDMAITISNYKASNNDKTNQYTLMLEGEHFIYIGSEPVRIMRYGVNGEDTRNIVISVESDNKRLAFNRSIGIKDPSTNNVNTKVTLQCWLSLEQMDGCEYFEWSLLKGSRGVEDSFYLYKLLTDQLHTEGLYQALQRAVSFIPTNVLYESSVHKNFLDKVEELKNLYLQYNGVTLTGQDLNNKESLQAMLDLKERELLDIIGILEINLRGSTVSYFTANMYNWDEDAMNALVAKLEGADTKGFFFESALNKIGNAPFSNYDNTTTEVIEGQTIKSQMYSIYSGLVAQDLSKSSNPPFHNDNVVAADYWSETEIKGAKEVYTNVSVPFVYKDGYYTLDSDKNGVFFEGEPASNVSLAILEKPITYYWNSGTTYGAGIPGYQPETSYSYRTGNNYVTGFQPFADVTEFSGLSYDTKGSSFQYKEPLDSYMIDGVGWASATEPKVHSVGRGTPEWGFGMKLDIKFQMTEDGCITADDGSKKPITFRFSGDDDVWVFIDGKLVMEFGGSHDAIRGDIDFSNGNVIISSEKYGRIRDKNANGYGRSGDEVNQGNAVGTIESNKMYQKNIYTQVFVQTVKEFAADGEHTMTVYYMDRGKGRTNCAISFNLPQTDTVLVEKEVPEYYGNDDGILNTDDPISTETMAYLNDLDFGFTLTNNGFGVSFQEYEILNKNGEILGAGTTDRDGHFALKNGQTARFRLLQFEGQSYQVTEDTLSGRWATPRWNGSAGSNVLPDTEAFASPVATVDGGQYESEIIRYKCTNVYIYHPFTYTYDNNNNNVKSVVLTPETQTVVMDYGKYIEVNVIDNAVFNGVSELVAKNAVIVDEGATVTKGGTSGAVSILSGNRTLRVYLKKLLEEPIEIDCKVTLTLDDGTLCNATIPVVVLPANIMYYETNFINLSAVNQVFHRNVKNPPSDDYNWTEEISDGKEATQDSGEVGDIVYKPVIDSERIPANAFFVDFDGEGYEDRYSVNPIYQGYDYDTATPWTTMSNAMGRPEGTGYSERTVPTIDQNKGVLYVNVGDSYYTDSGNNYGYGPHLRTFDTVKSTYYTIRMNPDVQNFVQIRFKLTNCKVVEGENLKVIFVFNRYKNEKYSYHTNVVSEILTDYDYEGAPYVTLCMPIGKDAGNSSDMWYASDFIAGLGFRFKGIVNSIENTPGQVAIDYIYVGPEMGWADNANSTEEYLYFGFENTASDQLRYATNKYSNINFDLQDGIVSNWTTPNGYMGISNFTMNNNDGTVVLGVKEEPDVSGNYGPSLIATNEAGMNSFNGNKANPSYSPLHFDPKDADFIQIRFKIENCEMASSDSIKKFMVYFSYSNTDPATGEVTYGFDNNYRIPFSLSTAEYQTIRIPIGENDLFHLADEIISFGFRFRGLKSKAGMTGSVTVDDIFIGSEDTLRRVDQGAESLFFDFDNTELDKERYSDHAYGGYNFDDPDNIYWAPGYGISIEGDREGNQALVSMEDSAVKMTIGATGIKDAQSRLGTSAIPGTYCYHGAEYTFPLAFPSENAEYIQLRFKTENCVKAGTNPPMVDAVIYYINENGAGDFYISEKVNYTLSEEYQVLNIPIASLFNSPITITAVALSFRYIKGGNNENGAVYIDYLYIGKMVDANPSASSLFIGFDNTDADLERYDSDTYGYENSDHEQQLHWWINSDKIQSIDIHNEEGSMEILAVPEMREYDDAGNVQHPDIYVESTVNQGYQKYYLDYKPQNAEVYQIRFKLENFTYGTKPNGTGGQNQVAPYVKLQWYYFENGEKTCATATETVSIDTTMLNSGQWITVTACIPEENRNVSNIIGIRPYFGGMESLSKTQQGKLTIDYIYIGPDDRPDQVYGYDSTYDNDPMYSNGHSLKVEGSGIKLNDATETYTETSFSFAGTGFDIISRTGPKQATIRLEVINAAGEKVKTMTVNNKGELELYQIPVVSVQGLTYGTYTVTLWVNKAIDSDYAVLNRGGEFYFDAVRIYDPINAEADSKVITPTEKLAQNAYKADRESFNHIKEIRNILLSKDFFESISDVTEGAVFIDVNSSNVDPETGKADNASVDYTTVSVETYNKIGPKNEVYLAPGQAVAFNLNVSTNKLLASLDVGAKTIDGSAGELTIGILAKDSAGDYTISTRKAYQITSSTAQYQELGLTDVQVKNGSTSKYQPMYLIIYNTSAVKNNASITQGVISVTDVKTAYTAVPSGTFYDDSIGDTEIKKRESVTEDVPVQFLVDGDTLEAAKTFLRAVNVAETPVLDDGARILHSLNLASDISLNYVVPKTDLDGYDNFYLEVLIPVCEGEEYLGDELIRIAPVEVGNYYYFTLSGLTAVQMNDRITAQLYMSANGRSFYSLTDNYSIADYALGQLSKSNASHALKTLCADLLVYGAKAQLYKGYRTHRLADEAMTEEYRSYLSDLSTVTFGTANSTLTDSANPSVTWAGKTLDLNSKVGIKYVIDLTAYAGNVKDLSLRLTYTDLDGAEQTVILTELSEYNSAKKLYSFTFDGLLAAELRTVVYAQVYAGNVPVSVTMEYSPASYGNNKTGTLSDLCRALFAYSDSAKAYFSN